MQGLPKSLLRRHSERQRRRRRRCHFPGALRMTQRTSILDYFFDANRVPVDAVDSITAHAAVQKLSGLGGHIWRERESSVSSGATGRRPSQAPSRCCFPLGFSPSLESKSGLPLLLNHRFLSFCEARQSFPWSLGGSRLTPRGRCHIFRTAAQHIERRAE